MSGFTVISRHEGAPRGDELVHAGDDPVAAMDAARERCGERDPLVIVYRNSEDGALTGETFGWAQRGPEGLVVLHNAAEEERAARQRTTHELLVAIIAHLAADHRIPLEPDAFTRMVVGFGSEAEAVRVLGIVDSELDRLEGKKEG